MFNLVQRSCFVNRWCDKISPEKESTTYRFRAMCFLFCEKSGFPLQKSLRRRRKAADRRILRGNDGLPGHGQQPHGRCYRLCGCCCWGSSEEVRENPNLSQLESKEAHPTLQKSCDVLPVFAFWRVLFWREWNLDSHQTKLLRVFAMQFSLCGRFLLIKNTVTEYRIP